MTSPQDSLDAVCDQIQKLRRALRKGKSRQVTSSEETGHARAVALSWFKSLRSTPASAVPSDRLDPVDSAFREILVFVDRATSREKYESLLKDLAGEVKKLRNDIITGAVPTAIVETSDQCPDFSRIARDQKMREILERRWAECSKCVSASAPLAATVMMGGLLESLLVARANTEPDKARMFSSVHAPVDAKTKKNVPLQSWGLKNYIDVASDMGWISASTKNIGEVLRDYRNYVHPQKEYSHAVHLRDSDAELFWEVTKVITRQLTD